MIAIPKLKIVTIESPYDSWHEPEVRRLFERIVTLKFEGFKKEYAYGVLPVDGSDFVATHHLVCDARTLEPLMAYKSISLERCRAHRLAFPALGIARGAASAEHEACFNRIIDDCDRREQRLIYNGGWVISPEARKNRGLVELLRRMMVGIDFLHLGAPGTYEIVSGGAMRFKVHEYLGTYGYKPVQLNGIEMGPLIVPSLLEEKAQFLHLKEYSENAKLAAKLTEPWWQERDLYCSHLEQAAKKADARKAA